MFKDNCSMSARESKLSWRIVLGVVAMGVWMSIALTGCATNKPVEVIEPVVCPDTYVEQYKSSQRQIDRYESALIEANASLNVCMQKFDKNLSKSR